MVVENEMIGVCSLWGIETLKVCYVGGWEYLICVDIIGSV